MPGEKSSVGLSGPVRGVPSPGGGARPPRARKAQTTVELLLMLPIFMMMIFLCMELGNIAHQIIVAHHAAYELARIGSLVAGPKGGERDTVMADDTVAKSKMEAALQEMFPHYYDKITLEVTKETTTTDPQAAGHKNEDLVVTMRYPIELHFPMTSVVLGDGGRNTKLITVGMRMPIEKPMFR